MLSVLLFEHARIDRLTHDGSVDQQTDAKLLEIIRSEFKNHTVIMYAQSLPNLPGFHRVAVIDAGRLM